MTVSLLEVRNVSKRYGGGQAVVTALEGVTFTVDAGSMLAILGPSGSGKTTLLSVIAGLLQPSSGEIVIDGSPIHVRSASEAAAYRREKIGLVFQDYHLIPYLSAVENLLLMPRLGGRVTHDHRDKAFGLLEEFDLGKRVKHVPSELSGGERQRVAIARALMNDPEIMLVDEPTANLDTERGMQVVSMLGEHVRSRKMTCLMVTHDQRMCEGADQVLRLVDGRMAERA
ncbi:MAG: ABC transporter ATP-binding protein [Coriobacteriia bacterium]|nr:ABC transporter ATP-binding protein [Coriobacteriia bacterium]